MNVCYGPIPHIINQNGDWDLNHDIDLDHNLGLNHNLDLDWGHY